ncbi:MAG: helix-turn-helix domain-containing protein [Candidatus Nanopelagicales bacterium]|nr:helix-turn-helix domain-containing protein [Candidatus Nanopelagicales bacterium]
MRTAAPLPLPLFRSDSQARILSAVFLSDEPLSVHNLSQRTDIPYSTTHREVGKLLAAGLLSQRRVGNTRLITPNVDSPFFTPLRELLERAFGPEPLLRDRLSELPGVVFAAIYGSWAERAAGVEGDAPHDIDVLVVGEPDAKDVYRVCRDIGTRLDRQVNPTILSESEWQRQTPFLKQVRKGPLVTLIGAAGYGLVR